jgi:uncharacterized protein (TIGR02246 family)
MSRLEAAVDRLELRELVERYGMGADTRGKEVFGALFLDDAVFTTQEGGRFEGRLAIVALLDHLASHYPQSLHFVGNHVVTLDGDSATGLVYCLAHHVYELDGQHRDTLMIIRYSDEYERTGDGWRISSRHLMVDWTEDRPLTV